LSSSLYPVKIISAVVTSPRHFCVFFQEPSIKKENCLNSKITVLSNEKCRMEHTAVRQLENIGNLPGVVWAVGLPGLHAGKSKI